MIPDRSLLEDLEAFVHRMVRINGIEQEDGNLSQKLDVFGRIIELLRIRTGTLTNQLSMKNLLELGIAIERGPGERETIHVASGKANRRLTPSTPDGWKQSELQGPLLVFLTSGEPARSIHSQIGAFVEGIRGHLSPADVETTKTGVARIATTTRSASRSLRLHGLLTESQSTAYKIWQPSVLGILVALRRKHLDETDELTLRALRFVEGGAFGSSTQLSSSLEATLRQFSSPEAVSATVQRPFSLNADVLESFDQAIRIVVDHCQRFYAEDANAPREPNVLRTAAQRVLVGLRQAIEADVLGRDVRVDAAIREIIGL